MKWVSCRCALDEQRVRLYCLNTYYWWSMQYEVVTSPSRTVQIHYNGDDGFALISGGTVCTFRSYIACIWHMLSMFDAIWGRNLTLVYTALIFIRSLNVWNGCCVGSGRTGRTFILLEFDTCYWWSMQYEAAISLSCMHCSNTHIAMVMHGFALISGGTVCTFRFYIACTWHILLIGVWCSLRS